MVSARQEIASTLRFVDEESIIATSREVLKQQYEAESAAVLRSLTDDYKARFRTAGFCRDKPVQILSPYDVPPGEMRKKWFEKFTVSSTDFSAPKLC